MVGIIDPLQRQRQRHLKVLERVLLLQLNGDNVDSPQGTIVHELE